MIVYRLAKEAYIDDLSGRGAELAGGRWNSKGTALIYTSEFRALCTVEVAVHLPLGIVPKNYWLAEIEFPDELIVDVDFQNLPPNWNKKPAGKASKKIGDDFVKSGKDLVLKVPGAVVNDTFNYLINPAHPAINKVAIKRKEPFAFDSRLFK